MEDLVSLGMFNDITESGNKLRFKAVLITAFKGEPVSVESERAEFSWMSAEEAKDKLSLDSSRMILKKVSDFITEDK